MIRGYARVSTNNQKDGNGLEEQRNQLRASGAKIIYEDSCSGKTLDRPQLNVLLKDIEPGDTLLVTKLDRLSRRISDANDLIDELTSRNITVKSCDVGVLDNEPTSVLLRNILFSFAEYERFVIVQRTQRGKAMARAKAEREGRAYKEGAPKKYTKEELDYAMELLQTHSYSKTYELTGISVSTLSRERRERREQMLGNDSQDMNDCEDSNNSVCESTVNEFKNFVEYKSDFRSAPVGEDGNC